MDCSVVAKTLGAVKDQERPCTAFQSWYKWPLKCASNEPASFRALPATDQLSSFFRLKISFPLGLLKGDVVFARHLVDRADLNPCVFSNLSYVEVLSVR